MFKSQKGFTLVEMLVVIAIIAILSGIFLVGFTGYRNAAKDAAAISDVHKTQAELELYYNQNGTYTGFNKKVGTVVTCGLTDIGYNIAVQLNSKSSAKMGSNCQCNLSAPFYCVDSESASDL